MSEEMAEYNPQPDGLKHADNLFDVLRPIDIELQTPEGPKKIRVRFPTDDEWAGRQRGRKIIIKKVGRNKTETVVPNAEEIDAAFLANIRCDADGPEVDQYEAAQALSPLVEAEVEDIERENGGFRIYLRVPGLVTEHVLAMPSAKDIVKYRRKAYHRYDLRFGKEELVVDPAPAGELYDRMKTDIVGYASPVPIIHKAAVIEAVIEEIESGIGVAGQENF